jgi:hypothetical protein
VGGDGGEVAMVVIDSTSIGFLGGKQSINKLVLGGTLSNTLCEPAAHDEVSKWATWMVVESTYKSNCPCIDLVECKV